MNALEMTHVSYFFAAVAAVSGCVSVVLYFVFDIRRCWRIVRGTHSVPVQKKAPAGEARFICQKTEKLAPDKTEILFSFEETAPPDTITLVQDIVMMTDAVMDIDTGCQ